MKTIVYIDGFNLYYGLLRGTRNMWLDLERFAQSLLTDQHSIIELKYFTARVRGDMYDDISAHDQFCYLRALVSGDSDQAAPLSVVRRRLGKKTAVFNPHSGDSVELRKLTTFYRNIPRELPPKCQLPDEVVLPDGTAVHRPLAWAKP